MAESTTLFNGLKFWLARKIPLRSKFVDDVEKHGGIIVPVERLADMLIVDHLLKDNHMPNSYSYRFIEISVRKGRLENKEDHYIHTKAAPIRAIGDPNQSARTIRIPFTAADDAFLVDWISKSREPLQGDKIFKGLEQANNRHTWQSWRARWVKRLRHTAPAGVIEQSVTSSTAQSHVPMASTAPQRADISMNSTSKQYAEVPRTQQRTSMMERRAKSPRRSYDHGLASTKRAPRTDPKQLHAILARLSGDTRQSSNHDLNQASDPADASNIVENSRTPQSSESDSSDQKGDSNQSRPSSRPVPEQDNGQEPSSSHTEGTAPMKSVQAKKESYPNRPKELKSVNAAEVNPLSMVNIDMSNTHSVEEFLQHEELAIKIWTDLLHQMGAADVHVFEGTASLIANAKIIRALDDEAFQNVWSLWWHSRPEKTEEEWAQHFNQFCAPFYTTHIEAFRTLFQQQSSDRVKATGEGGAAKIYGGIGTAIAKNPIASNIHATQSKPDVESKQIPSVTRAFQAEASPELGSRTNKTSKNHYLPKSENSASRQLATENPKATVSLLKRARSSSEVPESPRTPHDTDSSTSKRYKIGKHGKKGTVEHRRFVNKSNGYSRSSWDLKLAIEESSDENDQVISDSAEPWTTNAYKHRNTSPPDTPSERRIQASVDQQLWLEEEDAEQAENVFASGRKIPASNSPPTNKVSTNMTEKEEHTSETRRYGNRKIIKDQLPFVSDDSQSHPATPEPPSISELSEQGSDPHNSRPFYEASESAIQGDYEDLTTQNKEFIEAPYISRPKILPSIEKKVMEIPAPNKQIQDVENESESEGKQEGINEWINRKLRKGHSKEILTLVLNASMRDANLARKAFTYYQKFKRLPNTKPGIWTEEDDNMLLMHSRKGKRALIEKHGRDALDKRREYLETMRLAP